MSAPAGTGELVLATLYLAPTPEREESLRRAAAALAGWDAALAALEAHGVLGLALRNLERAAAALPAPALASLRERACSMRAIELGFGLTLERFLAEAQRAGIEVTLLKGASLALDLYPEGGLRTQGDLDLLVARSDVPRALDAAREIGLRPPPGALPAWWYRLVHFHLKLVPADAWQREIELHWHLHPLAQLYAVRLDQLFARRTALELAGLRVWTLDPLDRLLHLVTHLARHCPLGFVERETLLEWAGDARAPLRLKWLLDIQAEIERRQAACPPDALVRRAAEWNAEADLALTLAWIRARLGFAGEASAWVARVLAALPAPAAGATPRFPSERERALAGFDLRPSALLAFPRWVWPSAARFGRLSGNGPGPILRRAAHAARVLGRGALALVATPVAWLASRVRRDERDGLGPEGMLALAVRARELARLETDATSS